MNEPKSLRKRGLGRGLSALMDDFPDSGARADSVPRDVMTAQVAELEPNPFQPRRQFDEAALGELAESIRSRGMLLPILVRPAPGPAAPGIRWQIIAGERRWRAAQKAGLHDVPVVVRELDDLAALEAAIIENVQRRDLSPIEEAEGYRRLIDEFGHRQEDVARSVGKSRSHIANLLRLLSLPEPVRAMLADGRLSMGHARTLVGHQDAEILARKIVAEGLSVRAAEALVGDLRAPARSPSRKPPREAKDADTRALEADLARALGLGVTIGHEGEKGGTVTIRYRSLDQLDDLCQRLIQH